MTNDKNIIAADTFGLSSGIHVRRRNIATAVHGLATDFRRPNH